VARRSGSDVLGWIFLLFIFYLLSELVDPIQNHWQGILIFLAVALAVFLFYLFTVWLPEEERRKAEEDRRRRYTEWWLSQTGVTLEQETAKLFAKLGYQVEHRGGAGDEGVDLMLRQAGKVIVVQCKAHVRPVGPAVVRELYGTLMHHRAHQAMLASPSGFTDSAVSFAAGKPIELLDANKLVELSDRAA
jgi:restriction system protein